MGGECGDVCMCVCLYIYAYRVRKNLPRFHQDDSNQRRAG